MSLDSGYFKLKKGSQFGHEFIYLKSQIYNLTHDMT